MLLRPAEIHLNRARLSLRGKPYLWKSPQADLVAAEKLISDCGYHHRDGEFAKTKQTMLGL